MPDLEDKKEYITLKEAAEIFHYSQDYLSLRARQGKLNAVKFGKIWMTKKKWLEDYISKLRKKTSPPNIKKKESFVREEPKKEKGKFFLVKKRTFDFKFEHTFDIAMILAFLAILNDIIPSNTFRSGVVIKRLKALPFRSLTF